MKFPPPSPARHRRGFTLIELIVASSIAGLVLGVTMILLLASAKENKRGVADASVEVAASDLQNRIIFYLREMSATEGVIFANTATNNSGAQVGYKSIIVARGPAPDNPRQQISFDASQGKVTYNPTWGGTNSPVVLIQTNSHQALRLLAFSPSIKPDGRTDNALVNVILKLDDNGSSGRGTANPANVCRTFAVRMRNN